MGICENWFFCLFLAFYALYLVVEIGLDWLNIRHVNQHRNEIPTLFKGIYSESDYKKSIAYTTAKINFNIFSLAFRTIIVFILIATSFFGELDIWLRQFIADDFWRGLAYPFAISALFYLLGLPSLIIINSFWRKNLALTE